MKIYYSTNKIKIMEGFKQCANGHYYKNNIIECPYCPKQNSMSDSSGLFDKTQISNNETGNDNSKTQISISNLKICVFEFLKLMICVNLCNLWQKNITRAIRCRTKK